MSALRPGPRNLITDVPGLRVGQAQDRNLQSGVSVLTADAPFTAGVHVMGGAPGTRETDLLAPDKLVTQVDALVLSGGSAFGLDAGSGVADELRAQGRGFAVGDQRVPIVPGAILFDLLNGGDKAWTHNPYAALGRAALRAAGAEVALGSYGAGTGALVAGLRGGIGSASAILPDGTTIGALVAVNALGAVTVGDSGHFHAAACEFGAEFGGLGMAPQAAFDPTALPRLKTSQPGEATTIAIVATDAALDKAGCTRLAIAAHDGMARAIWPSHTPLDGDLVFAAATGARRLADPVADAVLLGHAAALCLARAIARGVHAAAPGGALPTWSERFAAA